MRLEVRVLAPIIEGMVISSLNILCSEGAFRAKQIRSCGQYGVVNAVKSDINGMLFVLRWL